MATFKKTMSGDSRYKVELTVNEITPPTSTDIANNSTRVTYSLNLTRNYSTGGYYTSSKTNPIKITINGEVLVNKKIAYDFRGETSILVASGTTTIQHEADGTKTIQCSGYFKDAENSLGSATASGSLTLTALHKVPEPYIVSLTELNTTLTGYGINNNEFVSNVSKKQFVINGHTYDSTTLTRFAVSNGSLSSAQSTSAPATLNLDFANTNLTVVNNKVPININVVDSMASIGTTTEEYSSYIPYFKPSVVPSNFTTKRAGQLTGDIEIVANGSYYNGSVGSLPITPKVYYRYKMLTPIEGNFTQWVEMNNVSASDGSWSVNETISSVFNPQNTYGVQIYCTDNLIEENNSNPNNTELTTNVYSSTVLIGEPTWVEYKDRVAFKKIIVNGSDPFEISTGNLTITKTSGNSTATGTYAKYGNIVAYDITLSTTASTASGGDIFVGTISNYTPKINTILTGYIGVRPIIASLTTDKKITVRNASASSLGSGSSPSIRGTFIVE